MEGNSRIQLKRGSPAFWASENPVLFPGQPGLELRPGKAPKLKFGDGRTPWRELPYFSSGSDSSLPDDQASLAEHILADEPHPAYDDAPSLLLLYQNAKV